MSRYSLDLNGRPVQEETYIVTAAGVTRKVRPGRLHDHQSAHFNYHESIDRGQEMGVKGSSTAAAGQTINGTATLKVAARETIKSAAGTFQAFRVDMVLNITAQGRSCRFQLLVCPGRGTDSL